MWWFLGESKTDGRLGCSLTRKTCSEMPAEPASSFSTRRTRSVESASCAARERALMSVAREGNDKLESVWWRWSNSFSFLSWSRTKDDERLQGFG